MTMDYLLLVVTFAVVIDNVAADGYFPVTGTMNGGTWLCYGANWPNLPNPFGQLTCQCPGTKTQVPISIGCLSGTTTPGKNCKNDHHTAECYRKQNCPCNRPSCDRFRNCYSCVSWLKENDMRGCASCHPGYELKNGDCFDINECATRNGGCAHVCHNTPGSFSCSCRSGYRLMPDKRGCEKIVCDTSQLKVANAAITPDVKHVDPWGYISYTCNDPWRVQLGTTHVRCELGLPSFSHWQGNHWIECRDTCDSQQPRPDVLLGRRMLDERCEQLGGCVQGKYCYHNTGLMFLRHNGYSAGDRMAIFKQEHSSPDGCVFQCSQQQECGHARLREESYDNFNFKSKECYVFAAAMQPSNKRIPAQGADAIYEMVKIVDRDHVNEVDENIHSMGCYRENTQLMKQAPHKVFQSHIYDQSLPNMNRNTVFKCLGVCRALGYSFAEIKIVVKMDTCYCTNSYPHESRRCQTAEDYNELVTVHKVPYDDSFRGCYSGLDTSHAMVMALRKRDLINGVETCKKKCASTGKRYSGLKDGGDCYCGDPKGGMRKTLDTCYSECPGGKRQLCGGADAMAVYLTGLQHDISTNTITEQAGLLYDPSASVRGFATRLWSVAGNSRSVLTNSLVIFSSESTQIPLDDDCGFKCYAPCGHVSDLKTRDGDKLILRFFRLRLSELPGQVGQAKQVFVYAQTVIVDKSMTLNFALLLRTRQLVVDRKFASKIEVTNSAPRLDVNLEALRSHGPDPDVMFWKLSFMCARILLHTKDADHVITAGRMLQDITGSSVRVAEAAAFAASVRTFQAAYRGLERADVNFVPYYSKGHISKILKHYYDQISLYKTEIGSLGDKATSQKELVKIMKETQTIYSQTNLIIAKQSYESCLTTLKLDTATYNSLQEKYEESKTTLDTARQDFEAEIQRMEDSMAGRAFFGFLKCVGKMVLGLVTGFGSAENIIDIVSGFDTLVDSTAQLIDNMESLTASISQMGDMRDISEDLVHMLEGLGSADISQAYADDLELTVELHVSLIEWKNFRVHVKQVFSEDVKSTFKSAVEYERRLLEYINWGEAMMKSVIEKAEQTRNCMDCKFVYEAKMHGSAKMDDLMARAEKYALSHDTLVHALEEQTYDIRVDLNNILLMFCQAYFYANLNPCKAVYQPSFGASLNELLLKISNARLDALLLSDRAPSSASRSVRIVDVDTDPDCSDSSVCPVNYLRKHRTFLYDLSVNHRDLIDLDKYMVSEILIHVEGAAPNRSHCHLKLRIESSGQFRSKSKHNFYDFVSRPLSLTYEYNIISGDATLRADVYPPFRDVVNYITPYTTWVLHVAPERSAEIDLTQVTAVTLTFRGSAKDAYGKKKRSYGSHAVQRYDQV